MDVPGEYHQAIGAMEAALVLMQHTYLVLAIYFNIVGAMASDSLIRHEDAQRFLTACENWRRRKVT